MPNDTVSAAAEGLPKILTPEARLARDTLQAEALRDLEGRTHDLLCAMYLLEMVKSDTIDNLKGIGVDDVRKAFPHLADFHIFILQEEESDSLSYALLHVGNLIRDLHRDYVAALEGRSS